MTILGLQDTALTSYHILFTGSRYDIAGANIGILKCSYYDRDQTQYAYYYFYKISYSSSMGMSYLVKKCVF